MLTRVLIYCGVAILLMIGVYSLSDSIMSSLGFETKASVKAELELARKDITDLTKVNNDLHQELYKKTSSDIVTDVNLGILFDNYKRIHDTHTTILDKKHNKPISTDPIVTSTQQIDSVWEMYCSFNKANECKEYVK